MATGITARAFAYTPAVVGTSTSIADICARVLLLGLRLRSSHEFGDAETLRQRIRTLLDRTEAQLRHVGVSEADARSILFALVAYLDESIIRSTWTNRAEWLARPMQFELFQRFDAGEEFFVRLASLQSERKPRIEVLEAHLLCLKLGFKGKYLLHSEEAWRTLLNELAAQVRPPSDKALALSPHGVSTELIAAAVRQIPVWVITVAAAAVAFLMYIILTVLISWRASGVEEMLSRG